VSQALQHFAIAEDDEYHSFDPDEWWSLETVWFAFTVPERALNVVIYLVTRPAMGVCALFLNAFDPSGREPWENRYWRTLWQLPLPKSLMAIDLSEVGFSLQAIEPLTRYHIRYQSRQMSFDVTWSALVPPRMSGPTHIDQFGRVTGELVLDGETIAVDCLQMRDRSWTRRSDLEGRHGGYTYGLASAGSAFLMSSTAAGDDRHVARGGWLLRDGTMEELREGERRIIRRGPAGEPLEVAMSGTDVAGRRFEAVGECVSRSAMHVSGNIFSWDTLVRWSFDGETCWGEDQDVWTPEGWRDQRRGRAIA
jgi:hypothetical protein